MGLKAGGGERDGKGLRELGCSALQGLTEASPLWWHSCGSLEHRNERADIRMTAFHAEGANAETWRRAEPGGLRGRRVREAEDEGGVGAHASSDE